MDNVANVKIPISFYIMDYFGYDKA